MTFHTHFDGKKETPLSFKTAQAWEENASTKLKALMALLDWHLSKDNRTPMATKDGVLWEPEVDRPLDEPAVDVPDKIIIYTYFIQNSNLISEVRMLPAYASHI